MPDAGPTPPPVRTVVLAPVPVRTAVVSRVMRFKDALVVAFLGARAATAAAVRRRMLIGGEAFASREATAAPLARRFLPLSATAVRTVVAGMLRRAVSYAAVSAASTVALASLRWRLFVLAATPTTPVVTAMVRRTTSAGSAVAGRTVTSPVFKYTVRTFSGGQTATFSNSSTAHYAT